MSNKQTPWWQNANLYHIYPASFKDDNGDGIGDIRGIISKLDYIKDMGCDAIWMCPMYKSPLKDMGYDVEDYEAVQERYGTMEDMEEYIKECHARGIRVILDLVMNHTSDQHAWFKESRSSRDNPKRDWYIWRPAKYDASGNRLPPNNWSNAFGGSAWEWDDLTQEYYLHMFVKEQPDTNWDNPDLRSAIFESAMRFWFRKGVDGFRVDVVNMLSKVDGLPDSAMQPDIHGFVNPVDHILHGPRIHQYLREMYAVRSDYGETVTIGEMYVEKPLDALPYVSASRKELDMTIAFAATMTGYGPWNDFFDIVPGENWTVPELAKNVGSIQEVFHGDGWQTTTLENQDLARSVSRFGSDANELERTLSAKMLALMVAAQSGTLILYQGQELGLTNVPKTWNISEYRDVNSLQYYEGRVKGNDTDASKKSMVGLQHLARDNARYPFSWSAGPHAGFSPADSKSVPWMRIHDDHKTINAESQINDPDSVRSFWKTLINLRKNEFSDALTHGLYKAVLDKDTHIFAFEKRGSQQTVLVALNMTKTAHAFDKSKYIDSSAAQVIGNYADNADGKVLRPWEAAMWVRS